MLLALAPAAARGQETTSADVLELTLPVLDLELQTASLDGALQRTDTHDSVRVTLAADVLFAFNQARLTPAARGRLAEVAAEIKRGRPGAVTIVGHTDSKGAAPYNDGLSRRRALAVRAALAAALGSDAPALAASGRGESDPVASNVRSNGSDNPTGRARNRRVEIRIPKPGPNADRGRLGSVRRARVGRPRVRRATPSDRGRAAPATAHGGETPRDAVDPG